MIRERHWRPLLFKKSKEIRSKNFKEGYPKNTGRNRKKKKKSFCWSGETLGVKEFFLTILVYCGGSIKWYFWNDFFHVFCRSPWKKTFQKYDLIAPPQYDINTKFSKCSNSTNLFNLEIHHQNRLNPDPIYVNLGQRFDVCKYPHLENTEKRKRKRGEIENWNKNEKG